LGAEDDYVSHSDKPTYSTCFVGQAILPAILPAAAWSMTRPIPRLGLT
jgi:hypothetical protein